MSWGSKIHYRNVFFCKVLSASAMVTKMTSDYELLITLLVSNPLFKVLSSNVKVIFR